MALIFDLESNGLLDELDRIHCLGLLDTDTGKVWRFSHQPGALPVEQGLELLRHRCDEGGVVAGHNVIKFDIPALQKVYPGFSLPEDRVIDTLTWTRLLWPDLKGRDAKLVKQLKLPRHLAKRHSLEAWGYRLGEHKGDFKGPWDTWTQEMEDYCVQDVKVTAKLFALCEKNNHSDLSRDLEHAVTWIIARQERYGFAFDEGKATQLYSKLVCRRLELQHALKQQFLPFYVYEGAFTPKRDLQSKGYTAGVPLTKVKLIEFNPASRDHIVNRLRTLYGWEPTEFSDDGSPKMDEQVIATLDIPVAPLLKEYFLIDKRIGQVAEGKQAWLKKVSRDGRMRGSVNSNGAVTGRMTHSHPNMGQVPAVYSPFGKECRETFAASPGKLLVGCDADALELRDLAGYMAMYDEGAYVETVLRGDKKQGTDMHSVNCRALGMDPKALVFSHIDPADKSAGRDVAKTWFYAFIYGAGDEKLGTILTRQKGEEARRIGGQSRKRFLKNLPALGTLVEKVRAKAKDKGFLLGLDKRRLEVRSQHAALNTLLQSAGAVQMKMALWILDKDLKAAGLVPGVNYEFVANVHDEWQIEVDPDKGDDVGRMATEAIRKAGEFFGFKCPLAGEYRVGRNWAETH